ncbi:DUF6920 family protein [Roseateles sp.]|uniref:DUF6920 family protein n=1 Tax=Roseateles sp. TaxID=1971397 RepID=UPI003D09C023
MMLWLGLALTALFVGTLALSAIGAARWAELVRAHTRTLESARLGARNRLPLAARFDVRELDGLPPPVQGYFRAVLSEGQPIIAAARIAMDGHINLSARAEHWKAFSSRQQVLTRRPGFLWDAEVKLFPGVRVHVEDSYIAGHGSLIAKVFGWFTVARAKGTGEIARGEFMRYVAEAPWYPTALLPSQGVRWEAVDDASAKASIVDGSISLTLLFRFDTAGLITSVHAESRGASVGKDGRMLMLPWDCRLSDYHLQHGMQIPMRGEAAWVRAEGRKVYFVGQLQKLGYEFLSGS